VTYPEKRSLQCVLRSAGALLEIGPYMKRRIFFEEIGLDCVFTLDEKEILPDRPTLLVPGAAVILNLRGRAITAVLERIPDCVGNALSGMRFSSRREAWS
jgi:hypothetical protein